MGEIKQNPLHNNNRIERPSINPNGHNGSSVGISRPRSASELQAVIDGSLQKASLTNSDIFDVVNALVFLRNYGNPTQENSPFGQALAKLAFLSSADKIQIQRDYNTINNGSLTIPTEDTLLKQNKLPLHTLFSTTKAETLLNILQNDTNPSTLKKGLILQELNKRQQSLTQPQQETLKQILSKLQPEPQPVPPATAPSLSQTQAEVAKLQEGLDLTAEQRLNIPRHLARYAARDTQTLLTNLVASRDPSESENKFLNRQVYSLNELSQRASAGKLSTPELQQLEQAKQRIQTQTPEQLQAFKNRFNVIRLFNAPAQARSYDEALGVKPPVAPPVILAEIEGERYSQNLVEALKISRPRPGETSEQQALRKAIILNEVAQRVQDKRTEPENLENAKAALKALPPEQATAIQQTLVATFPNSALAKEFSASVVKPQAGLPTANQTKTATTANPNVLPNLQIIFSRLSNQQLFSNLTTQSKDSPRKEAITDGHAYALNELAQRVRSQKLNAEEQKTLQSILYTMPIEDRTLLLARFQDFNTGLNSLAEVINPEEFPIKPGPSTASASTAPSEIKISNPMKTNNTNIETSAQVENTVDPTAEAAKQKALAAKRRKARAAYVNNTANQLAEQLIEKDSVALANREAENKLNALNMTAAEKQKAMQIVQAKIQRSDEVKVAATQWVDEQIQKNAITSITAPAQINEAMQNIDLSSAERKIAITIATERVDAHEAKAKQQQKEQEAQQQLVAKNTEAPSLPMAKSNHRYY